MKIPQIKQYLKYKNTILKNNRRSILNFNPDGREHYVYRLTNLTDIEKPYYYGSRTKVKNNIIEDFWEYGTSSKKKKLILENKKGFKVKIIKIFDNPGDKILYESYIH